MCRGSSDANEGAAIMKDGNVRNYELLVAHVLHERLGLRHGERDRLADEPAFSRAARITIVQWREAERRHGIHAGDPLDVAPFILERDLSRVDKRQGCWSVADGHFPRRSFCFKPMMGERSAVQGSQFEEDDASLVVGGGARLESGNRFCLRRCVRGFEAVGNSDATRTRTALQDSVGAKRSYVMLKKLYCFRKCNCSGSRGCDL